MNIKEFLKAQAMMKIAKDRYRKRGRAAVHITSLVDDAVRSYPVFNAIKDIKREGGLNLKKLSKDYGKDHIRDLMQRRPGIVSKRGKAELDQVAQEHGFACGDTLLTAIIDTPSKKAIIKDIRTQMQVSILKEMDLVQKGFQKTDGIYPDALSVGDEIYMQGYYMVVGFSQDYLILQGSHRILVDIDKKLPCEAIRRKTARQDS